MDNTEMDRADMADFAECEVEPKEERIDGMEIATKLISIDKEKKELEARLDTLSEKRKELEAQLLEYFSSNAIQKLTAAGRTVYIRREVWAGHAGDNEAFIKAMKESGLGNYVKESVNSQTFSAYVREFDPDKKLSGDEITKLLPEPLRGVVKVSEVFKIASRKA